MAPKDFNELEQMLEFSTNLKKPVLIRYPRGGEEIAFEQCDKIEIGKAEILQNGKEIVIISIGKTVAKAMKVAQELKNDGIEATVINARFLKPFDCETILEQITDSKDVLTIEDGTIVGGLGNKVEEVIFENKINVNLKKFAYPDEFIKHGSVDEIEKKYGLDVGSIVQWVREQRTNIKMMKTNC